MAPGGPQIEDCDLAYSIMESPFKRDIRQGIVRRRPASTASRIDLYFSHFDWFDSDFRLRYWNPSPATRYYTPRTIPPDTRG